jgi:hypothetical protein
MIRSFVRLSLVSGALLLGAAQVVEAFHVLADPFHGLVPDGYAIIAFGYCLHTGGYWFLVSKLPFDQAAATLRSAFLLFGLGSVAFAGGALVFAVIEVVRHAAAGGVSANILNAAGAAALAIGWLGWAWSPDAVTAEEYIGPEATRPEPAS